MNDYEAAGEATRFVVVINGGKFSVRKAYEEKDIVGRFTGKAMAAAEAAFLSVVAPGPDSEKESERLSPAGERFTFKPAPAKPKRAGRSKSKAGQTGKEKKRVTYHAKGGRVITWAEAETAD